jgi:hypothetical protein
MPRLRPVLDDYELSMLGLDTFSTWTYPVKTHNTEKALQAD